MTLVDHSADLRRLVEEGYDLEIRDGNLLVHHVPYVNAQGQVDYCILVSELTTNGESTLAPGLHTIWVVGGVPYDHQGNVVSIVHDRNSHDFGGSLVATCGMSGKPKGRMPVDYYEKISNYVDILSGYARAVNSSATHTDYPPRETTDDEAVFRYHDAATSRSGLSAVTAKLRLSKVAIVGLGGTGSYILDLVSKTPVAELHLFDDDVLCAHNAFRSPGAASLEELKEMPHKVDYLFKKYDPIRKGIYPHAIRVDASNIEGLREMTFVFLAMDAGEGKRTIIEKLIEWEIPFVDCGMGIQRNENSLRGVVRVTAGIKGRYDHIPTRVSYGEMIDNEYDWNIQTADLNTLNAVMAVIKWKKLFGYYVDTKEECNSAFVVARNVLNSGDMPSET